MKKLKNQVTDIRMKRNDGNIDEDNDEDNVENYDNYINMDLTNNPNNDDYDNNIDYELYNNDEATEDIDQINVNNIQQYVVENFNEMNFIQKDNPSSIKSPILCPKNIKPSVTTTKKAGISLTVKSNAIGKRTCVIATIKRMSTIDFFNIYCISGEKNLYLIVRSLKCDERALNIEKIKILFASMVKNRIKNQIENESSEFQINNINGTNTFSYDIEDITERANLQRQLLTMDGCSGDLAAMLEVIESDGLSGLLPSNTGLFFLFFKLLVLLF